MREVRTRKVDMRPVRFRASWEAEAECRKFVTPQKHNNTKNLQVKQRNHLLVYLLSLLVRRESKNVRPLCLYTYFLLQKEDGVDDQRPLCRTTPPDDTASVGGET